MKTFFTSIVLTVFSFPTLFAQNTVDVSATDDWIGFMNVFFADGNYDFGSPWGVPDLKTTLDIDANTVILQPNFNTYADNPDDPNWVDQTTGEGAKVMEASTFVEPGDSFNGMDLTFEGAVISNTLADGYEAKYFIKALDPDDGFSDALGGSGIFDLPESGAFSVTITGDQLPAGLIIQYGFSVTGRNANPDNEADLGNVTVGSSVVSVNDLNDLQTRISIFPNPVSDVLSIDSESPVKSYQVSTLLGQTVLSGQTTNNNVEVSSLAAGTYLITVQVAEGQKTMKFFKR